MISIIAGLQSAFVSSNSQHTVRVAVASPVRLQVVGDIDLDLQEAAASHRGRSELEYRLSSRPVVQRSLEQQKIEQALISWILTVPERSA